MAKNNGNTIHGSRSPEYRTWSGMLQRCKNKKYTKYHLYGGRGITVCERWHKFDNFLVDMGPRPEGLTLDRIDNNGNYEPGNCRWATKKQQARNMRPNIVLTVNGETKLLVEWAEQKGICFNTMRERIYRGFPPELVISNKILTWARRKRSAKPRIRKTARKPVLTLTPR